MEQDPSLAQRAYELEDIVASTIAADFEPSKRTDEIEYVIGPRGNTEGEYIIRTSETQTGLYDYGFEDLHGSQSLVIRHPELDDELTLIDFSYHPDEGLALYINKDVLNRINPKAFWPTDFVEYPMLGEIFYDSKESGRSERDFMLDESFMFLMRANTQWPFLKELPNTTVFNYSVLSNNVLCELKTIQNIYEGTHRIIAIGEYGSSVVNEVELYRKGNVVELLKPQQKTEGIKKMDAVYLDLDRLFS